MRISVALCTYNGASHLRGQIESILNQTRPPDEIVVRDDGSDDGTWEIVTDYAADYPGLFGIAQNERTKGVTKNFEAAIRACSGDCISLSDQDDVWRADKLETQVEQIRRENVGVVFHNSTVVSESLKPLTTLWDSLPPPYDNSPTDADAHVKNLTRRNYVQGATMLIDASTLSYCLPIPESCNHDYWIAFVVAICDGISGLDDQLLRYRRHHMQEVGVTVTLFERLFNAFQTGHPDYADMVEHWSRLREFLGDVNDAEAAADVDRAIGHVQRRLAFAKSRAQIYAPETSRLVKGKHCLANVTSGRYWEFQNGGRSAAKDIARSIL